MILRARELRRMLREGPDEAAGYLLHGPDADEAAGLREALARALAGEDGAGVARIGAGEATRDPAALADALRSAGFFGGRPVVVLEGATDRCTKPVAQALEGLRPQDGVLVAQAGQLRKGSSLRKLFEGGPALRAVAVYADALDRGEAESLVNPVRLSAEGLEAMLALGRTLSRREMEGFAERLKLYMDGEAGEAGEAEIAACAPLALDGEADRLALMVTRGDAAAAISEMTRLKGAGAQPGAVAGALGRHLRRLHGVVAGDAAALRPPPPPKVREALTEAARYWTLGACERTLTDIADLELALRSSAPAPGAAALERVVVRAAMTARRLRSRR